jgi:hypothetical protein
MRQVLGTSCQPEVARGQLYPSGEWCNPAPFMGSSDSDLGSEGVNGMKIGLARIAALWFVVLCNGGALASSFPYRMSA